VTPWRTLWGCRFSRLALLPVAFFGCGFRTELLAAEPCYHEGEERACEDRCGSGWQTCQADFWQPCEVEPFKRDCENTCGSGTEWCIDNTWEDCQVEAVERDCENTCGSGSEWCIDNTWRECEVEPTERDCENDCGFGIERCTDNLWSTCEVERVENECLSACGTGVEVCENGVWVSCSAPQPNPPTLVGVVRDFHSSHPDFERPDITSSVPDPGIIEPQLGDDELPVYAHGDSPTLTVASHDTFDQWYRDVLGVNSSTTTTLQLAESSTEPGLYVYENPAFFPIDGQLFGNEENPYHNYHFTLAVSTEFVYVGGETFTFAGDDDMWVFINRKLAIDLGGLHESMTDTIDLDARASELGLVVGGLYPLHFFFAERHTIDSNFTIHTSIADVGSCPNLTGH
jgi:fibro-slime domain-containing protein